MAIGESAYTSSSSFSSSSSSSAVSEDKDTSAGYLAARDGDGFIKTLSFTPLTNQQEVTIGSSLGITHVPRNAGAALPRGMGSVGWELPYALAVGVVSRVNALKGRPLWYEAAALYQPWAEKHALWLLKARRREQQDFQRVKLLKRQQLEEPGVTNVGGRGEGTGTPDWYLHNPLWLNTHWQCHDIFNNSGGDPNHVLSSVSALAERLDVSSLGLHWYEWQQGPDPDPAARYKFDTHYPDYFPPRRPQAFKQAISSLRDKYQVYTMPYINGRIFDIGSDSYLRDDGEQYCTKSTPARVLRGGYEHPFAHDLKIDTESYGSNATFCVANPFTPYWQNKIADTAAELINDWGVAGVYIDQIGASTPNMCWDASHDHTLGGGDWWRRGYSQTLDRINARLSDSLEPGQQSEHSEHSEHSEQQQQQQQWPITTENSAEAYMGGVQGYLSLGTFRNSLALTPSAGNAAQTFSRLAPAFPAVYGGVYVGFGAEWSQKDWMDHDWWRGKLAAQFITGAQMGWFSVAGLAEDEKCGPMATGGLLMDEQHGSLVAYLQTLARTRILPRALIALTRGRLLRPVALRPLPATRFQTLDSVGGGLPRLLFDTLAVSSWEIPLQWQHAADLGIGQANNQASDNKDNNNGTVRIVTLLTAPADTVGYAGSMTVDFLNWGVEESLMHVGVTRLHHTRPKASHPRSRDVLVSRKYAGTVSYPVDVVEISMGALETVILEFFSN
jgi:hypothetical protein